LGLEAAARGPASPRGASPGQEVCLAQAGLEASAELEVDPETGVIANVAILTAGIAYPALGEPFEVDAEMLTQVADSINAAANGGVKSRLTHPELEGGPFGGLTDPILRQVGRFGNARVLGNQVRADAQIGQYADDSPSGRLRTYLLGVAQEDPAVIGVSLRFIKADYVERESLPPLGRVHEVLAVDFVGDAGGNPNGLLSGRHSETNDPSRASGSNDRGAPVRAGDEPDTEGETDMKLNDKQRKYLASLGLAKGAKDQETEEFCSGLKPEQKEFLESLAEAPKAPGRQAEPPAATPPAGPDEAERKKIEQETLAADKGRREGITALAKDKKLPEAWAQGLCDRGVSLSQATELAALAEATNLVRQPAGYTVEAGQDRNRSTLASAMADAMCLRAGVGLYELDALGRAARGADGKPKTRTAHDRAATFAQLSHSRMAERFLALSGIPGTAEMSEKEILSLAMDPREVMVRFGPQAWLAMGSSDFPFVLGNVMRMSLRAMYAESEAQAIWPRWCGRIVLPDYRLMDLVAVSEVPELILRPEGAEVRFAVFTDGREQIQVAMFSRGMRWTQQAQKNDTLGVFSRQIRNFAGAVVRTQDRLTTAILTVNANMADAVPLFNAAHRNLGDVALTIANLSVARTALATQQGRQAVQDADTGPAILSIQARTLLCSTALEDTAKMLIASEKFRDAANAEWNNPLRNFVDVVGNPNLDATTATAWFLLGAPAGFGGGVQLAFLLGEEVPEVRTQVDFRTGALEVICEAKAGAKADDWRGLYCGHP
jgi:hypothetical protein